MGVGCRGMLGQEIARVCGSLRVMKGEVMSQCRIGEEEGAVTVHRRGKKGGRC